MNPEPLLPYVRRPRRRNPLMHDPYAPFILWYADGTLDIARLPRPDETMYGGEFINTNHRKLDAQIGRFKKKL